MATARNKLKAARTAIGRGDFSAAQEASLEVLEEDPSNYNASVRSPIYPGAITHFGIQVTSSSVSPPSNLGSRTRVNRFLGRHLSDPPRLRFTQAYRKAIQIDATSPLAWQAGRLPTGPSISTHLRFPQGIAKLYARIGQWNKHAGSLDSLAHVFAKRYGHSFPRLGSDLAGYSDDATKCAETLQKYVDVRKQHSGPLQVWVEPFGKHP